MSQETGKRQVQSDYYNALMDKQLHGQYFREIDGQVDNKYQWAWLRHSGFTPETEGFIMALQEQAVSTNLIKCRIYKLPVSPSCRLCHSHDESVDHLLSSCTFLVQVQYKQRHDKVAAFIHWHLAKDAGFQVCTNWWEHSPDRVLCSQSCKILWDYTIITDRHLAHNRPDITVVFPNDKKAFLVDIAIPGDSRITSKVLEKQTRYTDLKIEVEKLWTVKCVIVPIVVGALGFVPVCTS